MLHYFRSTQVLNRGVQPQTPFDQPPPTVVGDWRTEVASGQSQDNVAHEGALEDVRTVHNLQVVHIFLVKPQEWVRSDPEVNLQIVYLIGHNPQYTVGAGSHGRRRCTLMASTVGDLAELAATGETGLSVTRRCGKHSHRGD